MTNDNTDNTDEPSKAELHDRVQQLESTVAKMMPSRRDALKLGAAGIAGAAGLSAASQSAEASTGSAGQIGDVNNRPDLFADTVDANQLTGSAGFIKTKTRVFLSSSSPSDPIPFDSVSYDPDNNFDTNANEYIAPADGTYLLTFQARLQQSSTGARATFQIQRNGFEITNAEIVSENQFASVSVSDIRELSSGDSIDVRNVRNRTVNKAEDNTFLSIIRLE